MFYNWDPTAGAWHVLSELRGLSGHPRVEAIGERLLEIMPSDRPVCIVGVGNPRVPFDSFGPDAVYLLEQARVVAAELEQADPVGGACLEWADPLRMRREGCKRDAAAWIARVRPPGRWTLLLDAWLCDASSMRMITTCSRAHLTEWVRDEPLWSKLLAGAARRCTQAFGLSGWRGRSFDDCADGFMLLGAFGPGGLLRREASHEAAVLAAAAVLRAMERRRPLA